MKSIRVLLRAAMLLMVAGAAVAAESLPDGMRRCAAIADISVRVACYDQLAGKAPAAAAAPAPVVATPAPVAAPAPVVATYGKAGTPKPAAYGDAGLEKSSAERAGDAAPKSIDARIIALHEMAPSVFLISLDNGQIWQQGEARPGFTVNVGDTVRILSGSLGSYSMSPVSKGKTSGWVRVTRKK